MRWQVRVDSRVAVNSTHRASQHVTSQTHATDGALTSAGQSHTVPLACAQTIFGALGA